MFYDSCGGAVRNWLHFRTNLLDVVIQNVLPDTRSLAQGNSSFHCQDSKLQPLSLTVLQFMEALFQTVWICPGQRVATALSPGHFVNFFFASGVLATDLKNVVFGRCFSRRTVGQKRKQLRSRRESCARESLSADKSHKKSRVLKAEPGSENGSLRWAQQHFLLVLLEVLTADPCVQWKKRVSDGNVDLLCKFYCSVSSVLVSVAVQGSKDLQQELVRSIIRAPVLRPYGGLAEHLCRERLAKRSASCSPTGRSGSLQQQRLRDSVSSARARVLAATSGAVRRYLVSLLRQRAVVLYSDFNVVTSWIAFAGACSWPCNAEGSSQAWLSGMDGDSLVENLVAFFSELPAMSQDRSVSGVSPSVKKQTTEPPSSGFQEFQARAEKMGVPLSAPRLLIETEMACSQIPGTRSLVAASFWPMPRLDLFGPTRSVAEALEAQSPLTPVGLWESQLPMGSFLMGLLSNFQRHVCQDTWPQRAARFMAPLFEAFPHRFRRLGV